MLKLGYHICVKQMSRARRLFLNRYFLFIPTQPLLRTLLVSYNKLNLEIDLGQLQKRLLSQPLDLNQGSFGQEVKRLKSSRDIEMKSHRMLTYFLNKTFCIKKEKPTSKVRKNKNIPQKNIVTDGNFQNLVMNSGLFVDQSEFIKDFQLDPGKVLLKLMPPRWGKSVMIDMIRRFYQIKISKGKPIIGEERKRQLNYILFAGGKFQVNQGDQLQFQTLNIFYQKMLDSEVEDKIDSMQKQGTHPVIFLNLKDINSNSYDSILQGTREYILQLYKQYSYLRQIDEDQLDKQKLKLRISIKTDYEQIISQLKQKNLKELETTLVRSVKKLSELLHKYFNKKALILIDQYDAPLNNAFYNFGRKEFVNGQLPTSSNFWKAIHIFAGMMSNALKGNQSLYRGLITGLVDYGTCSILSSLNNINKSDLLDPTFTKYYGFSEEEVKEIASHYNIQDLTQMRRRSNGYNYGGRHGVYNAWAVAHYIRDRDKQYFRKSITGGILRFTDYMRVNDDIKLNLEMLALNSQIKYNIRPQVEYKLLMQGDVDVAMSFLVWTGILSPSKSSITVACTNPDQHQSKAKKNPSKLSTYSISVKTPNDQMREQLQYQLEKQTKWFKIELLRDMFVQLEKGDYQSFQLHLRLLLANPSGHILNHQKVYQNVFATCLNLLSTQTYIKRVEDNAAQGRLDCSLYSKLTRKAYIFKLKYIAADYNDQKQIHEFQTKQAQLRKKAIKDYKNRLSKSPTINDIAKDLDQLYTSESKTEPPIQVQTPHNTEQDTTQNHKKKDLRGEINLSVKGDAKYQDSIKTFSESDYIFENAMLAFEQISEKQYGKTFEGHENSIAKHVNVVIVFRQRVPYVYVHESDSSTKEIQIYKTNSFKYRLEQKNQLTKDFEIKPNPLQNQESKLGQEEKIKKNELRNKLLFMTKPQLLTYLESVNIKGIRKYNKRELLLMAIEHMDKETKNDV